MENKVILYSTGCPKCKILEKKLQERDVVFVENTSIEEMQELGLSSLPVLKVNDELLDFSEAVTWVNKQGE